MSQDRLSSLFSNRVAKEAIPPTPTVVTVPQVTVTPSAPQAGLTEAGQSTLTPNKYWRLLTDPGLTPHPSVHTLSQMLRRVNKQLDEVQKEVTKSKEETSESSKRGSPFVPEIQDKPISTSFRLPALESYDGNSDPTEHVAAFRAQIALYDSSDALMCRVFPTTLRGPTRMWYSQLSRASIFSFDQLVRELEQYFLASARPKPTVTSHLGIAQGREESLA
ncbi:hypothetical protein BHE74_00021636 [Ensete ventricosum]|nr:hypothetical protein BHE74_00021636 [Ensete ventricosum]RZR95576.1 hypothetical protein BHM03_00024434 [Ensete ventricosum]